MQIESLKVYCDVVRHRSFSQAAQLNSITQSAVSQIVSHIEKRLGLCLIDRSTRPLRPTDAGQQYFEGCSAIVEDYVALEASLSDQQLKDESPVSVAAIYSVGLGDMQQIINEFSQRAPNSKVRVEYLHPDKVWEHVLNETSDLGLLSFPRKSRDIVAHPWREEAICLACAPSHPLASNRDVDLQQLDGEAYVAFDRELVIRRKIDRYLRDDGVKVDITMEFDNIESIKKAVSFGQGIALLPRPSLTEELNSGALVAVPLRGTGLVRPLGLIHHRHRLSPSTQKFADLLLESSNLVPTTSKNIEPLAVSGL
mgnify:CR=1 FL=1